MKPVLQLILIFTLLIFIKQTGNAQWKVNDKVQVMYGNTQYYNAQIIDVKDDKYKIRYDGYGSSWDEWVTTDRIKAATKTTVANGDNTTATQSTKQSSGYYIGQKVEAFNIQWYKALF